MRANSIYVSFSFRIAVNEGLLVHAPVESVGSTREFQRGISGSRSRINDASKQSLVHERNEGGAKL